MTFEEWVFDLCALISREYPWHSQYVRLGVMSLAIGALFAVPLTKNGLFSRERKQGPRTDSVTFQHQVIWSSHLVQRIIFMISLPWSVPPTPSRQLANRDHI